MRMCAGGDETGKERCRKRMRKRAKMERMYRFTEQNGTSGLMHFY